MQFFLLNSCALMERFCGSEFTATGCTAKKKRSNTPRRPRSENKLKKVKLKLGGVTRTIHANSTREFGVDDVSFAANGFYSSVALQPRKTQGYIHPSHSHPLDTRKRNDSSQGGCAFEDTHSSRGRICGVISANGAFTSQSVRKSKRVPKRRVWDMGFSGDDEDEEIRYLGRLNASKIDALYECEGGESKRGWRKLKVLKSGKRDWNGYVDDMDVNRSSMSARYGRANPRSEKAYEDEDHREEEETTSDDEPKVKRETLKKESVDLFGEEKKEMTSKWTNRATKDDLSGTDVTFIGLPTSSLPAPCKKQKDKPSEMEQQLKKAEAAQRRRLQSEKAAMKAQSEAIRKILGQDSARKKREEKIKKQRDDVIQERAANSMTLSPSTVRWVIGPTGTIVTFSEDIGLPSIFNSVDCSYPRPREKCAGPNCKNSYKYRDSQSNLPLCSLLCYRAMRLQPLTS
ncbi:hypothetical protein U1Q18_015815 [Sarracenia purpurea var. burkii]